MTISNLREALLDFAWSAWAEMGSTALARPTPWVVDPEALVIFTAGLVKHDRRLEEAALDSTSGAATRLSEVRLRNMSIQWRPEGLEVLESRLKSADRTRPPSRNDVVSERPGAFGLRLRAALGLGARTEILRAFISSVVPTPSSASTLVREVGYRKRNVADALFGLEAAGVLVSGIDGNTITYTLTRPNEWEQIFGPVPTGRVSFFAATRSAWTIWSILEPASAAEPSVRSVEARRSVEAAAADLRRLHIMPPNPPKGTSAWRPVLSWTEDFLNWLRRGGVAPNGGK